MRPLSDLFAACEAAGLPYAQLQWPQGRAPDLPYVVVVPDDTRNVFSDGTVRASPVSYMAELYSSDRDVPLELRFQSALDARGIGWNRYHTTDPSGPVVIAVYQMTLTEQEASNG